MDAVRVKFLKLMFRPGEEICPSHDKYAYHSVPLEYAFDDDITLVPTDLNLPDVTVNSNLLTLVALNPIKGTRNDENCTAYRNFLIEMDTGELPKQLAYIKQIGLPYSAAVFSGSKSIHFLVSLDQDLPNEDVWRMFAEWILNIATMADKYTKNPSRGIRIPGGIREPGKIQLLVEQRGPTKIDDLFAWLQMHPDAQPRPAVVRTVAAHSDFALLSPWCRRVLVHGLDKTKSRNVQWFSVACDFALAGFDEDETIAHLDGLFTPERTFGRREWKASIHSGFKPIGKRD